MLVLQQYGSNFKRYNFLGNFILSFLYFTSVEGRYIGSSVLQNLKTRFIGGDISLDSFGFFQFFVVFALFRAQGRGKHDLILGSVRHKGL